MENFKQTGLVVHLLHGTWARGPTGRRKAWTEPGSEARSTLESILPPHARMEAFIWTGRNSVKARSKAAGELRDHLTRTAQDVPGAPWLARLSTLQMIGLFVYAPAAAGCIYLIGYVLLAVSVGYYAVWRWLTTGVEIDAAPPGVMCNLFIYSDFSGRTEWSLRHGLYEHEGVLRDVASLVIELAGSTKVPQNE